MDINLDSLGSRNFEHLTQALAVRTLGPRVSVFGDGPDAGREASWSGDAVSLNVLADWNGYGVLQAKFHQHPVSVDKNLTWIKAEIRKELNDWSKPSTKRVIKPEFILFSTNVRLSPGASGGKDQVKLYISDMISELDLPIRDFRVWDYDDLRGLLDDAHDIRRRYSAFLTPGDLIAQLIDKDDDADRAFSQAMMTYIAKAFRDDNHLNLIQAGAVSEHGITIADVFIDLPAGADSRNWSDQEALGDEDSSESELDEADMTPEINFLATEQDQDPDGNVRVSSALIGAYNSINDARLVESHGRPAFHKTVLIGGPGQGKSTVTQWLAQIYRAEFLRDSPASRTADIAGPIKKIRARQASLGLPTVQARRWPFRVILTELADYLAEQPSHSLLHFIAAKISDGSSVEVLPSSLRRWLERYPWLLLVDGLDEVPASSNRQEVMKTIKNFFLDVDSIGGDVATLATTRPQGYGDEFSPKQFFHLQLIPLPTDVALTYAQGLVSVRTGLSTPTSAKVMARLRRASGEEPTRRLFESPLQITILTVLLEKLGKAPGDRSRLFSAYYQIISQREQEKSGELSDLLQKYEADVDYLHRVVGDLLQKRNAGIGETSSSLDRNEFDQIIVDRFSSQGHDEHEVEELRAEFSRLVTDRLVFLSLLTSERIGFELRSLQEFMAGEYLVNLPESEILPAVEQIAISPYWRNVVLFALGSVFAHKEHLRAEVVMLCERLNDASQSSRVLLPGSDLAFAILRDGSCASMPLYARRLTSIASRVIEGPSASRVVRLASLQEPDLIQIVRDRAESTIDMGSSVWMNRLTVLEAMPEDAGTSESIAWIVDHVDQDMLGELIHRAAEPGHVALAEALEPHLRSATPRDVFGARRGPWRRASPRPMPKDDNKPESLRQLMNVSISPREDATVSGHEAREGKSPLRMLRVKLGLDTKAWEWLAKWDAKGASWAAVIALAEFSARPSKENLARALELAATADQETLEIPDRAPWVYTACLADARSFASHPVRKDDGNFARRLNRLAKLAREGKLGDFDQWEAAEARIAENLEITTDYLVADVPRDPDPEWDWDLPVWPELVDSGLPVSGSGYQIREGTESVEPVWWIGFLREFSLRGPELQNGSRRDSAHLLAGFVASFVATQVDLDDLGEPGGPELPVGVSGIHQDRLDATIDWLVSLPSQSRYWLGGLLLASHDSRHKWPAAQLRTIGSTANLVGTPPDELAEAFIQKARESDAAWPLYRLALISRPSLVHSLSADDRESIYEQTTPNEPHDRLIAAVRLCFATPGQLWKGDFDDDINALAAQSSDPIDLEWINAALIGNQGSRLVEIGTRGASLLARSNTSLASYLYEVAWVQFVNSEQATAAVASTT